MSLQQWMVINKFFLLLLVLGDLENDQGWKLFLKELCNVIGSPQDLILIFDCHISIKNTVEEVFPNAAHDLCGFHMKKNLKKYRKHKHTNINMLKYVCDFVIFVFFFQIFLM